MGLLCVPGSLLVPITEIYIAICAEISNYISKKDLLRPTRGKAYVVSITYKPRFRDETKLCIVLPKIMDDAQKTPTKPSFSSFLGFRSKCTMTVLMDVSIANLQNKIKDMNDYQNF